MELKIIARIRNDFPEKFGLPRQSGLVEEVTGEVVFEKEYRDENALRGLEEFSHIWLIWGFSQSEWKTSFSPTVRPPRLGGNKRMGVFATRSPYRPNPVGLSCVRLDHIEWDTPEGPVLHIRGADLMHGTPIYDVKPYLPYVDAHPEAIGGFGDRVKGYKIDVVFPENLLNQVPESKKEALIKVLEEDPRPSYHQDDREYGLHFADMNIRFAVKEHVLTVLSIMKAGDAHE